ncbi:MAG: helix-turn-helix transcriptional regulator [Pseudonocardiaceae bacterium]
MCGRGGGVGGSPGRAGDLREPAARGSGLVLVTGDAGIGKTRMVTEVLGRAREHGAVTLAVGCLPLVEKLPLLPVIDALRELDRLSSGRVIDTALDQLPQYVRAELARLLPRLSDTAPVASGGQDVSSDRERLFTAVSDVLLQVAHCTPVVLLVEDVHWADGATLDLLTYLRATARGSTLSLMVTCRSDEAPLSGLVVDWLAHCRSAMVTEIRLAPLARDEVALQAAGLIGSVAPAGFVEELYVRAEGNPFLTEQLVAAALAAPGEGLSLPRQLPGGLAELLVTRVRQVSDDARTALAALAVAGRPLAEPRLAGVAGLDERGIRGALRELSAAALLAPDGLGDACRARHALLAEAVLADLLPGERAALHSRTAKILEAVGDPALSAEVAAHWAQAGRPVDELRASVVAAEVAVRVFAFAEAAALWQRAIRLCEQLPDTSLALELNIARLHVQAVDALEAAGQRIEAGKLAEAAYARFADGPDSHTVALIHLRVARFRQIADGPGAARPLFEKALRLFEEAPPSADHVEALWFYAGMLRFQGRAEAALPAVQQGLRVAQAARAVAPQARILSTLGYVNFLRGEVEEGFAALQHARVLADALDDAEPAMWIAMAESDALLRVGRPEQARLVALEGVERARRGGRGGAFGAAILRYHAVHAMLELGGTDEAAGLLAPVIDGKPELDGWAVHMGRVVVDLCRGLVEEAAQRLEVVLSLPIGEPVEVARELAQRVAEVALWRRMPGQALDAVERVLARLEGTDQELFCGELFVLGLRATAERSRARGDLPSQHDTKAAVDRLTAALQRMGGRPFIEHPFLARIPADRVGWAAEGSRAAGASDPGAWEATAAAWENLRRPHRAAYAWWRCAQAHLAQHGRPTTAARPLQAAAAAAEGMTPLLATINHLAQRARIPLCPPASAAHPTPAAPTPVPHGLTDRERQVLRLLAHGHTNTQIGAQLYISPKTAGVHVTNILRKLHVSNRTQAAAVAERASLLDDLD